MTKYRAVKNKEHRIAKMVRRVRRVDDTAENLKPMQLIFHPSVLYVR